MLTCYIASHINAVQHSIQIDWGESLVSKAYPDMLNKIYCLWVAGSESRHCDRDDDGAEETCDERAFHGLPGQSEVMCGGDKYHAGADAGTCATA